MIWQIMMWQVMIWLGLSVCAVDDVDENCWFTFVCHLRRHDGYGNAVHVSADTVTCRSNWADPFVLSRRTEQIIVARHWTLSLCYASICFVERIKRTRQLANDFSLSVSARQRIPVIFSVSLLLHIPGSDLIIPNKLYHWFYLAVVHHNKSIHQ